MFNFLASIVNLGSSQVALIDLIMLGVILFALIFGSIKGFFAQILSILGTIAAIVIAVSFCDEVADYIKNTFPNITEGLSAKIGELFGLTDELLQGSKEQIINSLAETKIPAFLHEMLANAIVETAGDLNIVNLLTKWSLIAISFVGLFIVTRIVFIVVKLIFKGLTKNRVIGALDRALGALLMALKFIIIAMVLITVLSVFINMNPLLAPVAEDGTVVNSVFNKFISWIMQLEFIQNLFV